MVVPHSYVVARPGWNATLQVSVLVGLVVLVNITVVLVVVGANISNTKAFQHFVLSGRVF